jgi:hypothetical protein
LGLAEQPGERDAGPSKCLASVVLSLTSPPLVLTERAGAGVPFLNRQLRRYALEAGHLACRAVIHRAALNSKLTTAAPAPSGTPQLNYTASL